MKVIFDWLPLVWTLRMGLLSSLDERVRELEGRMDRVMTAIEAGGLDEERGR